MERWKHAYPRYGSPSYKMLVKLYDMCGGKWNTLPPRLRKMADWLNRRFIQQDAGWGDDYGEKYHNSMM